jgi:replicative DNA helicase
MSESIARLPPHSDEAERAVLGCCFLDPVTSLSDCHAKLQAGAETFYDQRHQAIYRTMAAMAANMEPVDVITVQSRLRKAGILEQVGGLEYLSTLPDSAPSAANLGYYLEIVREKHALRSILATCHGAIDRIYTNAGGIDQVVDAFEREAMAVGTYRTSSAASDHDGKSIVMAAIEAIQDRCRGNDRALATGWARFDQITKGGLKPGRIYVVAGRPGTGKTAFTVSLLMSIARQGKSVGFISLEMDAGEIGERMLSVESQVDVTAFDSRNKPEEHDNAATMAAAKSIKAMKFAICDRPNSSAGAIAAKARRWLIDRKIDVLAIDYLQLVESKVGKDRREQVDHISRSLKLLAKELQIPVILLAQLNREFDKDKKRKPRLSDLRESGSIEQDADFVGFLYSDAEPDTEDSRTRKNPESVLVKLLIAKQRGGMAGLDVNFTFRPHLTRFDPTSPIEY